MDNGQDKRSQNFESMINEMISLSKLCAIVSSVYQYKRSEEKIADKTSNEENVLIYGINDVNSKILKDTKKYESITNEKNILLEEYKNLLSKKAGSMDGTILHGYMKLFNDEMEEIEMFKEIYDLRRKEERARAKLDNSDDEIAEKIYEIEETITKNESKIRRLRTTINAKIREKDSAIADAMESEEKKLQKELKGPRFFSNAKKLFFGKINPKKAVENRVFSKLRNRIEEYRENEISKVRQNGRYVPSNIIKIATDIENKKR